MEMAAGVRLRRALGPCTRLPKRRATPASSGALRPIAATNCLNFGNPEKPEVIAASSSETIDGIAEACRVLEVPITGGNVSFYNETLGQPIYPTPILGVLGLLENAEHALGSGFRNEGDLILLLDGGQGPYSAGQQQREFSSSEYAKTISGIVSGEPPAQRPCRRKNGSSSA